MITLAGRILIAALLLVGFTDLGRAEADASAEKVECPQCGGTGIVRCRLLCQGGKIRCPRPCLKLDDRGWKHLKVANHPPEELWMEFPSKTANKLGGMSWSQQHIGELIEYVNNLPVNKGKCPTCGGTSMVACAACKGTGVRPCPLCAGAKEVGKDVADGYQEKKLKDHEDSAITLVGGRVIHGKVIMRTPEKVMIKTEDGKVEEVPIDQIVTEAAPAPAPTPTPDPVPAPAPK